jgi:hypothetical protein
MEENYKEMVREVFLKEKITINDICDTQNSYNSKVFKVIGDNRDYIIKFYKDNAKRLCEEKYLRYLKQYIKVASVISSSAINNYNYIIMEYLNGDNIPDENCNSLSKEQLYRVGVILGTLHSLSIIDDDNNSWINYLYNCLEISKDILKSIFPNENDKIQEYLKDKIKTLIEKSYNNSIMHMDFRFGNLIFTDSDISVIDFESAKNGDYVFDFVKINRLLNENNFQQVISGYKTRKELDNDFFEKLDFYSLFDSYTSLYWCVANNQTDGNFYKVNYEKVKKFLRGQNGKRFI